MFPATTADTVPKASISAFRVAVSGNVEWMRSRLSGRRIIGVFAPMSIPWSMQPRSITHKFSETFRRASAVGLRQEPELFVTRDSCGTTWGQSSEADIVFWFGFFL